MFIMDSLVTMVSTASQAGESKEMIKYSQEMDIIAMENGIFQGTHLNHSAASMIAMDALRRS